MVIERATHDTYADQLTKRIIKPLGLRDTCLAPHTCPAAAAARMPAGYFAESGAPAFLDVQVPPLALTWAHLLPAHRSDPRDRGEQLGGRRHAARPGGNGLSDPAGERCGGHDPVMGSGPGRARRFRP